MDLKKKILAGAELMFLRNGFKSVTMDDIARELGMSKKTLYQFVDNKADLVGQVLQNHGEEEIAAIAAIRSHADNAIDEILAIAKYAIQFLRKMGPGLMYDLQKYYRKSWEIVNEMHEEHIYKVIKSNIEWGIADGLYRSDFNIDVIAKLYVRKSMIIVDEKLFPLTSYSREALFTEYINYHIHGIASQKGLKLLKKHEAAAK